MTFCFPNAKMNAQGYVSDTTMIFNYPIQGFATGEIVPIALRLVWEALADCDWARVALTVHDSIILGCRKDRLEDLVEILSRCMLEGTVEYLKREYGYEFTTPLEIEIKAGSVWGSNEFGEWKRANG
jgi:DNA polymerase I-like protein with 3'-5' exonuclease and polymerase domains